MRNKEFQKLLKKNKSKSNSGFTLIELISGLIMSVIVVGILGFGVVQVLRLTKEEGSQAQARSETTRAMDFITDEIRRASEIDNDAANANGFNVADSKVVLALNVPEINSNSDPDGDGELFGVDDDLTTSERIVYYLKSTDLDPWEGPQVLYRWGPPLDANGNYTDGDWDSEALIDKIDNTTVTSSICGTGQTLTPATSASGFYACISDDDNDGVTENLTDTNNDNLISTADGYTVSSNDTNGDGVIDDEDGADVDGTGISAQLYFTGGVDTVAGDNKSNYSTNTQVVARARTPQENNPGLDSPSQVFFRSLGATYGCNPTGNTTWTMRTDFANDINKPNRSTKWIHRDGENRQPQPLKITNTKLEITSVPIDPTGTDCLNDTDSNRKGNRDLGASDPLYEKDADGNYVPTADNKHTVKHVVDFDDPTTFNGYEKDNDSRDNKFVIDGDKRVIFLKEGTILNESYLTRGYDPDDDSSNNASTDADQRSLGEFLADPDPTKTGEPTYAIKQGDNYIIKNLNENERIVAFEIGWDDVNQPGFDLQDNVFLMRTDLFAKEFESDDFQ